MEKLTSDSDEYLVNLDTDFPDDSLPQFSPIQDRRKSNPLYGTNYNLGTGSDSDEGIPDGPEGLTARHQQGKGLVDISVNDLRFFEEEVPFEVEISKASGAEYSETCCFRLLKRKAVVYSETKAIRAYRRSVQKEYHKVIRLLDWPQLPGGEHDKAKEHNYLAYQLWLITYAATGLPRETLKSLDKSIVKNLEDSLVLTEQLGITAMECLDPLRQIIEKTSKHLEEMNTMLEAALTPPETLNRISQLEDAHQGAIFVGNQIRHFAKLRLYMRDLSTKHWNKFTDAPEKDQVSLIDSGFVQFVSKLKDVKKGIDGPVLKKLKEAMGRCGCGPGRLSLIPHVERMHKRLQEIVDKKDKTMSDEYILKCLFQEVVEHIQYIVEKGEYIVAKIKELVFYNRLCHHHLQQACAVGLEPTESFITNRFRKKNFIPYESFDTIDFFYVSAPDILRRVPIIFNAKQEWALHYDGYRNSSPMPSIRESHTYGPSIRIGHSSQHTALSQNSAVVSALKMEKVFRRKQSSQASVREERVIPNSKKKPIK